MIVHETKIKGAFVIERTPIYDERGYFSRVFCKKELSEKGLNADFVQSNMSLNLRKGTVRGLHAQKDGYEEDKLVACTRGRIFDVCIDIRKESDTYGQYVSDYLTEENGKMLYIPKGCAHGYMAMEDDSQAIYFVTQFYEPGSEIGFRFDEPVFNIQWPIKDNIIISDKDSGWEYIKYEIKNGYRRK